MMPILTADQLTRCMPGAHDFHVILWVEAFQEETVNYGINTPGRMAAFLAQVGHESGSLRYREELASGAAYTNRKDLGNTHPKAIAIARASGADTGPFYKGHGFIQITGYTNHLAYSLAAYNDDRCVLTPMLLTKSPDCVGSACWFWATKGLNKLADNGTEESLLTITRRINGGYNGLKDRRARWIQCKSALGVL